MVNNCPGLVDEHESTVIKNSVDVGSQELAVSNITYEEPIGEEGRGIVYPHLVIGEPNFN